ncbi:MAG TPA: DUF899 family protein [Caulobacteraceae bacterium]|jgi:predicted dithiol-disulfide oxidoreductase (DUF899 family)|nr:DUF899 family protein [Caulobacteraceae bacterium]
MTEDTPTLVPADQLARENPIRMPGESADYRAARQVLLAQEFELRRQIERVAALRRALPPGGAVTGDYRFETEDGPRDLASLFGGKDTLVVYNYMFGPERQRPCPMCTSTLDAWDGNADSLAQRVSLVVVARSPLQRLLAVKRERGWKHLRLAGALGDAFTRDYGASPDGGLDEGGPVVFTRRGGAIRHFWSQEMVASDPGQDPRGAPDLAPLWTVLDMTPEGRGADFYPKLEYPA